MEQDFAGNGYDANGNGTEQSNGRDSIHPFFRKYMDVYVAMLTVLDQSELLDAHVRNKQFINEEPSIDLTEKGDWIVRISTETCRIAMGRQNGHICVMHEVSFMPNHYYVAGVIKDPQILGRFDELIKEYQTSSST